MNRTISAILASSLLIAAPVFADETSNSKKEETKADGSKVKTEKSKKVKDDGTGEANKEVSTTDGQTGAQSKKTTKVKKTKNSDGTTETKASTEVKTKQ